MSNCKSCHFPIGILGQVLCLVYRFFIFALLLTLRMIRKYHNHTLQTNLRHREKESHNTNSHKTSGRQLKQRKKTALSLFLVKMITILERTLSTKGGTDQESIQYSTAQQQLTMNQQQQSHRLRTDSSRSQ